MIFASDATHLTNFSSDGKLCPVYIGNISSTHAWIPIVLPPVGPKRVHKKAGCSVAKQERETLGPMSNSAEDGITARCGDGVVENCTIHVIYNTRCGICKCSADELGNHGHSNRRRDHEVYKQWVQEEDAEQLKTAGVKLVSNAL